jgi:anhydro-N-acetylmuramic acid kinase
MIYQVIGLMSGTSLDGLDIAGCTFELANERWTYRIECAETVSYDAQWQKRLRQAMQLSGLELTALDTELGIYFGELVQAFRKKTGFQADFVASHGHTIFHNPHKKITLQVGKGSALAAATGLPVVCDFRSLDVFLGGQGAPLVPIGDQSLFSDYDFCLNLGGISNISFDLMGQRQAFDICVVNMALNDLAHHLHMPFDANGEVARRSTVQPALLHVLNNLSYYQQEPPKSLGKEWYDHEFFPLLKASGHSVQDVMATTVEHIAFQIGQVLKGWNGKMLITGGGAWNSYLVERIQAHTSVQCVVPDAFTVNYKEALIFAFLGLLRWHVSTNTLATVTGAERNSIGGAIYWH